MYFMCDSCELFNHDSENPGCLIGECEEAELAEKDMEISISDVTDASVIIL